MHETNGTPLLRRVTSMAPALLLLSFLVVHWTATQASGRLVQLGGWLWPGYAAELRSDLAEPEPPAAAAPAAEDGVDDALIDDLLADDPPAKPTNTPDDALIGDLLADDPPAKPANAPDDALIGDLLADDPPPAGQADQALINDLLGDAPPAKPAAPAEDPMVAYQRKRDAWVAVQERLTPGVRAFRAVDHAIAAFTVWGGGMFRHALVLLIAVGGLTASALRGHIALRSVETVWDARLSSAMLLATNLLMAMSQVVLYRNEQASGTEIQDPDLPLWWAGAFVLMAAVDVVFLLRPRSGVPGFGAPPVRDGGSAQQAIAAVPLHAWMGVACSVWFLGFEQYPAGMAIYMQSLTEHAQLYLMVGLYVWTGMLLKQTTFAPHVFAVLRPWKLAPEVLAIVLVACSALPTAYSGASGIFVIAVGALLFRELVDAGARPQLALAATAMSGSLGVVLRPCLLVVIVAYLNPVTTDVLYGWGVWVYALTAVLFAIVVVLTRTSPLKVAPVAEALPASLRNLGPLMPYFAVALLVLVLYGVGLGSSIDEHTAPLIFPVVFLALILLERAHGIQKPAAVQEATAETTHHIGALLLLMSMSIAVGGVFERAEVMSLVPEQLGSVWTTMAALVVVLVVVGMTMDPYGAVILVSATIAGVAYRSGIEPAHFWMVVLCSFELGYLTPPVALNHLLARQVVGAHYVEDASHAAGSSWWYRNERLALPLVVMGTALLIVAFVPLLFTE
jgi:TRAP-type C4-dicarboxylate transport system permease large subunit